MTIATLTPEERQIALQKSIESRAVKAAHNKANEHLYKLDYLDGNHWRELGSKHKVRMPSYNEPCTAKGVRKMMRKVGISNDTFKEHYTSVEYFIENNPKWTLWALAGLLLELKEGRA
jgi:hypothetical protein